jgi:hypothetical protein
VAAALPDFLISKLAEKVDQFPAGKYREMRHVIR